MNILTNLNEAQKLAVTTTEGPVMVMAGAGSGKTKVLTTRIAYLISELGIPSSQILAVTFTNKAANEMKERVETMLSIETKHMWISTFHSFCSRLLRLEIEFLPPYHKSFSIIDEEDSLKIVRDIMKKYEIEDFKPKEIKYYISKSKNFLNYKIVDPLLNGVFLKVNAYYEEYLRENNLLDFDDLIIKTIELFKSNPEILKRYQNKFQYILVDEFQDTNALQYNLMLMLANQHHNLFVVGDDFQSIYSFRGAQIENIHHFREDFLDYKLILLEQNYRSTSQILELANCIIENNPNQIKKKMFSDNHEGKLPFYYHAESSYDEVMFVINKIKELVASGESYSDFAILYRANYISRNFEDILIRNQIPYKIYGGLSFFARKEVKDIVAYLRVLIHPEDDFSFRRIINEPKRKIGPALLEKLTNEAYMNKLSLFETIELIREKGQGVDSLKTFKSNMDSIRLQIENVPLKKLIDIIIDEMGYEEYIKKDKDTYEDKIENIYELKSVLKEAEEYYDGTNKEKLEALLSDLSLRTDNENDDITKDNCVRLSTYHQVKGLEFKNVFMVAMEEGIFPSNNCIDKYDIEEERRICYVGITRAKERLYITNAESRFLFGGQSCLSPSRFVEEMKEELIKNVSNNQKNISNVFKNRRNAKDSSSMIEDSCFIKKGDKVNHKIFGNGIVISSDEKYVTILFENFCGIKKILSNHPSIRKT